MEKQYWTLNESDYRIFLLGFDTKVLIEMYLESKQDHFDKEFLINRLIECYEKRVSQDIGGN